MALERKPQFHVGSFAEKRALAVEIVSTIRRHQGRFLKKADGEWVPLDFDRAINKTMQVMRDIDRVDRRHRIQARQERKRGRKLDMEDMLEDIEDTQGREDLVQVVEAYVHRLGQSAGGSEAMTKETPQDELAVDGIVPGNVLDDSPDPI